MDRNTPGSPVADSFTRKAAAARRWPVQTLETAVDELIRLAGLTRTDRVLDVGCGPGSVACRMAGLAGAVAGLDVTPAMLALARRAEKEQRIENVSWYLGDACSLPFKDNAFSVVTSRYAFHHIENQKKAFSEMVRVCRTGGRVLLADVAPDPGMRDTFDRVERFKDPSHWRSLTPDEFSGLARKHGLSGIRTFAFGLEIDLDRQGQAAGWDHVTAERIRQIYENDIGKNALGVNACRSGNAIRFSYPSLILAGRKTARTCGFKKATDR